MGSGGRWGGLLFEAGRLLTFSAFRMGVYSRWALIRGWALIRINTVDIIYYFGPNLKSQEKKKYSLSQCPNMNKVKFQLLIIYYCVLLLPLLIYFLQAYNIFHGLGGNDAIIYEDWSSKPLVIYSELHEP